MHKARVFPIGFGPTFSAVFVLIHWLREFPLSAVTYGFELRCQLESLLPLYYKISPCWAFLTVFIVTTSILCFKRTILGILHPARLLPGERNFYVNDLLL